MGDDNRMVLGTEAFNCGIQKSLIHAGKNPINYVDGTKVFTINNNGWHQKIWT